MTFAPLSALAADARIYLRPCNFVDSPVGLDGRTARLGQGLLWFSAVELTAMLAGERVYRDLIAVEQLEDAFDALPNATQGRSMMEGFVRPRPPLTLGERVIRFDVPHVMGILNMTPDSFSDGGKHMGDPAAAADAGFAMIEAGAAIIDVGGESTRPGAETVWEGDEIKRVVPVIERLAKGGVPVSVDTRKAAVMEAALAAGAHMVNDVSGLLHDPRSMEVVARAGCPVVLMHAPSSGNNPHAGASYGDAAIDVYNWLAERVEACVAAGIARDAILIDPGIGFGKALQHSLAICNALAMFQGLGLPLIFGASRKRVIGALSNEAPASARLGGSVTLAHHAIQLGAQVIRVHDVQESLQAIHVWRGLRDAAIMAG
ncbi:dihydropteroate synthase [Rhizorhapis sp. SPR117]|uniref:dihydropteroate synthase n=1 Tax=Rhizorhapis sp. SPR117 TaxID=2912611 RepID=UPI001EFF6D7C|nr:dihydropteroate synthase [Rhizorhapis sp. SPR117]